MIVDKHAEYFLSSLLGFGSTWVWSVRSCGSFEPIRV